jgi:hypothetical protein
VGSVSVRAPNLAVPALATDSADPTVNNLTDAATATRHFLWTPCLLNPAPLPGPQDLDSMSDPPREIVSARARLRSLSERAKISTAAGCGQATLASASPPDVTRPGWRDSPASLTRVTRRPSRSCDDVAREQGVDEAQVRSRVRPVSESPRHAR